MWFFSDLKEFFEDGSEAAYARSERTRFQKYYPTRKCTQNSEKQWREIPSRSMDVSSVCVCCVWFSYLPNHPEYKSSIVILWILVLGFLLSAHSIKCWSQLILSLSETFHIFWTFLHSTQTEDRPYWAFIVFLLLVIYEAFNCCKVWMFLWHFQQFLLKNFPMKPHAQLLAPALLPSVGIYRNIN